MIGTALTFVGAVALGMAGAMVVEGVVRVGRWWRRKRATVTVPVRAMWQWNRSGWRRLKREEWPVDRIIVDSRTGRPNQVTYPCGCVTCVCEHAERCLGCGAKRCRREDAECVLRRSLVGEATDG